VPRATIRLAVVALMAAIFVMVPSACKSAKFETSNLVITPARVVVGGEVIAEVDVANVGNGQGRYRISVKVDDQELYFKTLTLAAGASEKQSFTLTMHKTGTHLIEIGGLQASVEVISFDSAWEDTRQRMLALKSFHFEEQLTLQAANVLGAAITGDVLMPDRIRATMDLQVGFLLETMEVVILGDEVYTQDPHTEEWTGPSELTELFFLNPMNMPREVHHIEDPRWMGTKEVGGVLCEGFRGKTRLLSDLQVGEETPLAEVWGWIGCEDRLIRKITMEAIFTEEQPITVYVDIEFSNFNQEITIEAPISP